jgi:Mg-chelatase subunit ChlD
VRDWVLEQERAEIAGQAASRQRDDASAKYKSQVGQTEAQRTKVTTRIEAVRAGLAQRRVSAAKSGPAGSILILLDSSGSMSGARMEAAKSAARTAVRRALDANMETAVFTFSGSSTQPITGRAELTKELGPLEQLIARTTAGGGTPLGAALREASTYLSKAKSPSSRTQMIVLLADGGDDTGDIEAVLAELARSGMLVRTQTIGLGVGDDAAALSQLERIAARSGGSYFGAAQASDLGTAFQAALDQASLMNLVGSFGTKTSEEKKASPSESSGSMSDILSTW